MSRVNVALFILLAFIWGSSYTFIKIAVDGLTPAQLVLGRVVLGAVVLFAVLTATKGKLPRNAAVWGHTVVTALLGMVVPFLLLAWGEQRTSAAMAGVLIAATPLLTLAAVTTALPAEKVTWRKGVGFVVGFVGVVLVIGPWSTSAGSLAGQLAVLGAALCYALQTVYVKKMLASKGVPPLVSATTQVITATVLQAIVTPFFPWKAPHFSVGVIISILLLGIVGTGLAYLIYFRLIGDLGAANASAVNYLVPITAVLVSLITLGESISWNMVVGTVIVLAALAFAENRVPALAPART
ncbi:DMT family transporter [Actinokineospora terrae]|uniref:Permease of the drug/metabolite transporter (DMT) superfamily n=1 Tax=Actinokineospora terrae TaxID=155974 RepID=A0A1H9X9X7_9PSEU|nr:DMT family transporter [Actinokineospora terrae]SES42861.1 Permease of the drug/metabolite transporter (DMT) superfamily [Actinokineospora terrae]